MHNEMFCRPKPFPPYPSHHYHSQFRLEIDREKERLKRRQEKNREVCDETKKCGIEKFIRFPFNRFLIDERMKSWHWTRWGGAKKKDVQDTIWRGEWHFFCFRSCSLLCLFIRLPAVLFSLATRGIYFILLMWRWRHEMWTIWKTFFHWVKFCITGISIHWCSPCPMPRHPLEMAEMIQANPIKYYLGKMPSIVLGCLAVGFFQSISHHSVFVFAYRSSSISDGVRDRKVLRHLSLMILI